MAEKSKSEKQDVEVLAQLAIKKMGADPKEAIRQKANVYMGRVFGEAADFRTKENRNGNISTYFIGEFRGVCDGKQYESTKLYLPQVMEEQVLAALKGADGKPVQFGYDVFSVPDDKIATGYRWAAKTLLKTEASDRLTQMAMDLAEVETPAPKAAKAK